MRLKCWILTIVLEGILDVAIAEDGHIYLTNYVLITCKYYKIALVSHVRIMKLHCYCKRSVLYVG